jgi:hypothetical protein
MVGLRYNEKANAAGAQTERRGVTGRFFRLVCSDRRRT